MPQKKKFKKPYHVETQFERDRASVILYDSKDNEIMEWWDEEVNQAIEDGFLEPRDYLNSAIDYAKYLGVI